MGCLSATTALPSLQARTSDGVASEFAVGLARGGWLSGSVSAAISRIAVSEKTPGLPLVPIRIVGATWRMTVSRA